jgi:hypothetical protein
MIKTENSFTVICDTCKDFVNSSKNIKFHIFVDDLKIGGWKFVLAELHSFPYKPEEIKKTTCPECDAKRKAELCNSKDIQDRIAGGYYNDKSHMQFKNDALEHVGLTNHPKAEKAFALAWEHGHADGYESVLNWLKEITDLVQ